MAKFLFLFIGLASAPAAEDDQTRAYRQQWFDYTASLVEVGKMDSGLPLEPTAIAVKADSMEDRRLETEDVYGYMVVSAESMDEAIATARRAPHMALGGTTIIRPCIAIGG